MSSPTSASDGGLPKPATGSPLLRGTAITSALSVLSRALGFVRDLLSAHIFGAGAIADAYFVAFRIPNLLRSLVAEGALTAAFVPVFSSKLVHSKQDATQALRSISSFLLLLTIVLSICGIYWAQELALFFAPGFADNPQQLALCALLTRIMFPFIICMSLVATLSGALNALKIFGQAAVAQVCINLCLIAGALLALPFASDTAAILLAASLLVGGIVGVLVQLPALQRAGISAFPLGKVFCASNRQILLLMLPAVLGASLYQLGIFISTLLSSLLEEGSVSWLYYADRITQFPVGVFSIALASVLLPTLAEASAQNDKQGFSRNLVDSLRYCSALIIPIAAGIALCAKPVCELAFERGAFSDHDTARTAAAVIALSAGLWSVSCYSLLSRAFLARKNTVVPTLLGALGLLGNTCAALLLMGPATQPAGGAFASIMLELQSSLHSLIPHAALGHVGLALASSFGSTLSFIAALLVLHFWGDGQQWRPFVVATFKSLLAASSAFWLAHYAQRHFPAPFPLGALGEFIALGSIFGLLYLGFARCLRQRETLESCALLLKLGRRRRL
jgi:putative peptidoglycan lipid II flippase